MNKNLSNNPKHYASTEILINLNLADGKFSSTNTDLLDLKNKKSTLFNNEIIFKDKKNMNLNKVILERASTTLNNNLVQTTSQNIKTNSPIKTDKQKLSHSKNKFPTKNINKQKILNKIMSEKSNNKIDTDSKILKTTNITTLETLEKSNSIKNNFKDHVLSKKIKGYKNISKENFLKSSFNELYDKNKRIFNHQQKKNLKQRASDATGEDLDDNLIDYLVDQRKLKIAEKIKERKKLEDLNRYIQERDFIKKEIPKTKDPKTLDLITKRVYRLNNFIKKLIAEPKKENIAEPSSPMKHFKKSSTNIFFDKAKNFIGSRINVPRSRHISKSRLVSSNKSSISVKSSSKLYLNESDYFNNKKEDLFNFRDVEINKQFEKDYKVGRIIHDLEIRLQEEELEKINSRRFKEAKKPLVYLERYHFNRTGKQQNSLSLFKPSSDLNKSNLFEKSFRPTGFKSNVKLSEFCDFMFKKRKKRVKKVIEKINRQFNENNQNLNSVNNINFSNSNSKPKKKRDKSILIYGRRTSVINTNDVNPINTNIERVNKESSNKDLSMSSETNPKKSIKNENNSERQFYASTNSLFKLASEMDNVLEKQIENNNENFFTNSKNTENDNNILIENDNLNQKEKLLHLVSKDKKNSLSTIKEKFKDKTNSFTFRTELKSGAVTKNNILVKASKSSSDLSSSIGDLNDLQNHKENLRKDFINNLQGSLNKLSSHKYDISKKCLKKINWSSDFFPRTINKIIEQRKNLKVYGHTKNNSKPPKLKKVEEPHQKNINLNMIDVNNPLNLSSFNENTTALRKLTNTITEEDKTENEKGSELSIKKTLSSDMNSKSKNIQSESRDLNINLKSRVSISKKSSLKKPSNKPRSTLGKFEIFQSEDLNKIKESAIQKNSIIGKKTSIKKFDTLQNLNSRKSSVYQNPFSINTVRKSTEIGQMPNSKIMFNLKNNNQSRSSIKSSHINKLNNKAEQCNTISNFKDNNLLLDKKYERVLTNWEEIRDNLLKLRENFTVITSDKKKIEKQIKYVKFEKDIRDKKKCSEKEENEIVKMAKKMYKDIDYKIPLDLDMNNEGIAKNYLSLIDKKSQIFIEKIYKKQRYYDRLMCTDLKEEVTDYERKIEMLKFAKEVKGLALQSMQLKLKNNLLFDKEAIDELKEAEKLNNWTFTEFFEWQINKQRIFHQTGYDKRIKKKF